jgi:hypothetical protein
LKKNQEKQKVQEQQKAKISVLKIQKNVRAFLKRITMVHRASTERNIKFNILMKIELTEYSN